MTPNIPDPLELVRKVTAAQSETRKPRKLVNATEADGANQIGDEGYGEDDTEENSRVIPGTRTVQYPARTHADDVNDGLRKSAAKRQAAHNAIVEAIKKANR